MGSHNSNLRKALARYEKTAIVKLWVVFDPKTGAELWSFASEADAARKARQHGLDYDRK